MILAIDSPNTTPNASEFVHMNHISWAHMWQHWHAHWLHSAHNWDNLWAHITCSNWSNLYKKVLPIYSSNTAPNASEFIHMSHISWAHMWDSKGCGNTDTPTSFVPLIIGILMSPYHMLKLVRIIGQLINGITWTHMIWTSEYWFGKVSWACVYHHGSEKNSFFI